jgi:hypothetical protein
MLHTNRRERVPIHDDALVADGKDRAQDARQAGARDMRPERRRTHGDDAAIALSDDAGLSIAKELIAFLAQNLRVAHKNLFDGDWSKATVRDQLYRPIGITGKTWPRIFMARG